MKNINIKSEVEEDRGPLSPFVISSETHLLRINYSKFCWMDIPEDKLKCAIQNQDSVQFRYHHSNENDAYECSYVYTMSAQELNDALLVHREVYRTYKPKPFYRVYLEYRTGCLFTTYCQTGRKICQLNAVYEYPAVKLGSYALEKAIKQLKNVDDKIFLMQLVASCAVWAPKEAVLKQRPDEFKYVRFKNGSGKKKNDKEINDEGIEIVYDDNTQPNRLIKNAVKEGCNYVIAPYEYHVCHIWEGTCYKRLYHTDLRNVVLLPSSIHSLSDHDKKIMNMLKCRSAELYGELKPEGRALPRKPACYKKISWPEMKFLPKK